MNSAATHDRPGRDAQPAGLPRQSAAGEVSGLARIAVGVDGRPESRDAVVLARSIAAVSHGELLLVGVHPDPLVVLPDEMSWESLRLQAAQLLTEVRESYAPKARTCVERGPSVPRALEQAVTRERQDLLVVGSSRRAAQGRVRIGTRTRQLLSELRCGLAIAPRGLQGEKDYRVRRIGVGYDGHEESTAALVLAGELARASGAELTLCGVVDDRIPALSWSEIATAESTLARWEERVVAEMDALRDFGLATARAAGVEARAEIGRGRPADPLLKLSEAVDLLVIGSRRWGALARVLLGSTGEALTHDAACPLLVVPGPRERAAG